MSLPSRTGGGRGRGRGPSPAAAAIDEDRDGAPEDESVSKVEEVSVPESDSEDRRPG